MDLTAVADGVNAKKMNGIGAAAGDDKTTLQEKELRRREEAVTLLESLMPRLRRERASGFRRRMAALARLERGAWRAAVELKIRSFPSGDFVIGIRD
ncbi:hypothetical protein ACP70R_015312 [Stipagrostis hirtigluma subsp. patula]